MLSRVGRRSGRVASIRNLSDSRVDLLASIAVAAIAFSVYTVTLAPGITWKNLGGDGGDLLTAAFTWGIPHPSGYPTYLLSLRGFSYIFPFGEEAFRGNVFSAALAAGSVAFVFLASLRLLQLLPQIAQMRRWVLLASAAIAGLSVGVSRELWSQATITEVYALNAFFVAALTYGLLVLYGRHVRGEAEGRLRYILAAMLGLGLGNHLTLAVFALPFIVWSYFWGFSMAGRSGPAGVGAGLAAIGRRLLDWRTPAAFLAGLAVYFYAPIASFSLPDLNWGHPENADGFWWMVSGSLYKEYQFGIESSLIPGRITDLGDLVLSQYAFVGVVLAFAGLSFIWESHRGFVISGLAGMLLVSAYAIGYDTADSFLYLIPVFVLLGIWMSAGVAALLLAVGRAGSGLRRPGAARLRQLVVVALILGAVPGFSAFSNFDGLDLSGDHEAANYAHDAIARAGAGGVVVVCCNAEVFSLWYQSYVAEPEADVLVISKNHLQFDWYWDDVRRQAPDRVPEVRPVGFTDRVRSIVNFNLGARPVYAAGDVTRFPDDFTLDPAGDIYRVLP